MLDSLLTYNQSKYATVTSLQNAITNMANNIPTEINNLEIPSQATVNVEKCLYYQHICSYIIPYPPVHTYTNTIHILCIMHSTTHNTCIQHIYIIHT